MFQTYPLGNGDDFFEQSLYYDEVYGGNGSDTIHALKGPTESRDSNLYGENGDDVLSVRGRFNKLYGGNGDDLLSSEGNPFQNHNHLDGGRGADQLISVSFHRVEDAYGAGNILTGGPGPDSFFLRMSSDLRVTNDGGSDSDILSDGDIVAGYTDLITDYAAGEPVLIGATTKVGTVGLDGSHQDDSIRGHFGAFAGHQHPELANGEYAIVRGTYTQQNFEFNTFGEFQVSSTGNDLLVLYDPANRQPADLDEVATSDSLYLQGGVVLQGFTDANSVVIG